MQKKTFIKVLAFFLVLCFMMGSVSFVLQNEHSLGNDFQGLRGFYKERENSLDAVYIGSSVVGTNWVAPLAWEEYGIAVYPFWCNGQLLEMAEYMVKEARKTQPNAVYIININETPAAVADAKREPYVPYRIHWLIDHLPFSLNKIDMIKKLSDLGGYSFLDRLEFIFPFLQYHTRWSDLTRNDFDNTIECKGAIRSGSFLTGVTDITKLYNNTTKRVVLGDNVNKAIQSLLDYCDKEQLKVLFVISPQARINGTVLAEYNEINDILEARGYPVLNLMEHLNVIGIDLACDYNDLLHPNIHGAMKITNFLGKYLIDNYQFESRRGNPDYADWDYELKKYIEKISPYTLDFERSYERRTTLSAPTLSKLSVNGTTLTLSWKSVYDADGYCVYRKSGDSGWQPIATVGADKLSYQDSDCKAAEKYTYTVAPFQERDGERYWGTYDFSGLSATAAMNAPSAPELSGSENNLTLVWKGVKGADGYQVFRRVFGKSWIALGEVAGNTTYTDTDMLEDMPYQYRVRAYWLNENGEKVYGSYSKDSLWLPELTGPEVTVSAADGVPTLTWPTVEGISNYTVTRRTADGGWEQIAEPLAADCTQFRDITAKAGVQYEYQVTANIVYSKETYPYPSESVSVVAEAEPLALDVPEIVFAEQVGDGVQLVWEPSENATAYRIYRQAAGESEWTVIKGSQGGSTYQDKPPEAGTYTYILQPLRTEDGCTYYGEFDENAGRSVTYSVE